jgi:hypothetical protein
MRKLPTLALILNFLIFLIVNISTISLATAKQTLMCDNFIYCGELAYKKGPYSELNSLDTQGHPVLLRIKNPTSDRKLQLLKTLNSTTVRAELGFERNKKSKMPLSFLIGIKLTMPRISGEDRTNKSYF